MAQRGPAGPEKKSRRDRRGPILPDESGFYLLPGAVRTYSPCGHTPCLEVERTGDHLSVLGGITPGGRLFARIQRRAIHGGDCVGFLKRVRSQLGPKLAVIWDGSPIHRGDEVARYLAERPSGMVQVERLPGYAPDLNPQEGVREHLKHVELRNCCSADLDALGCGLTRAIARLRHKVALTRLSDFLRTR